MKNKRGYTLVELIISVGLFALIMMLASGAYFVMININRQAQDIATGINNLSFALETMTRTIRTGTNYGCPSTGVDCPSGGTVFSVISARGIATNYSLSSGAIIQNGVALTDPSINISSLIFYVSGTSRNDNYQPRVTITVSGTISSGPSSTESFTLETGATMRGIDI